MGVSFMNWVYAMGYQPAYHLYDLLYTLIVIWAGLLLIASHVTVHSVNRQSKPSWLLVMSGLGILSIFTESGLVIMLSLFIALYSLAPWQMSLLATVASIGALHLFFRGLLPQTQRN